MTATVTALTQGATYTLPGYVGWALPVGALDHRSRVSRLAAAQGVILVAAYEVIRHPLAGAAGDASANVARVGGPLATLGLMVLLTRATRAYPGSTAPITALNSVGPTTRRSAAKTRVGALAALRPVPSRMAAPQQRDRRPDWLKGR